MCIAVKRALMDETKKQNNPKPVDQEAAAVDDPLKIKKGVVSAASQNPAVKAVTTQAKKTKPVNSGLQVGTPY